MGKAKKARAKKYGRAVGVGAPYTLPSSVSGDVIMEEANADADQPSKKLTRGMLLKRHRLEYKKLRAQIADLEKEK